MKKVMLMASEDMCDILQKELDSKYITLSCSDPMAGEGLLNLKPDVLIMDLFLPVVNSMAFLKAHAFYLPPVTITITRYIDDMLLQELSILGVSSVILIPFQIVHLIECIESMNPSR